MNTLLKFLAALAILGFIGGVLVPLSLYLWNVPFRFWFH